MKTLPANISSNYLLRGNQPRIFVNVGGASYYVGSQSQTIDSLPYEDRIKRAGVINTEVEPFGGMAKASGVSLSGLELDGNYYVGKFCTEAEITPVVGGSPKAGSAISTLVGGSYSTTRNSTTGSNGLSTFTVGQKNLLAPAGFSVFRGFLEFTIPAALTSCEDAYLTLTGSVDASDTDFEIIVLEGEWGGLDATTFRRFDGWNPTTTYTGTQLNNTFDSNDFVVGANYIVLNGNAAALIEAAAGTEVKFMLISSRDYTPTSPSGDEFMRFGSSTATLTIRYNTETLINQVATIYLGYQPSLPTAAASMLQLWTGVVDGYNVGESALALSLRQNNFKKNVVIPKTIISEDNFPKINSDLIGGAIPIVYGDFTVGVKHKCGIAYFEDEQTAGDYYGLRDYFKAFIYSEENEDERIIKAIVADHPIKEFDHTAVHWESTIKSFTLIAGDITDQSSTDTRFKISKGTALKFPYGATRTSVVSTDVQPVVCHIPQSVVDLASATHGDPPLVQTIETVYDLLKEDVDESFMLFAGIGYEQYVVLGFDSSYGVTALFPGRYVCFYVEYTEAYSGPILFRAIRYWGYPEEAVIIEVSLTAGSEGWHYHYMPSGGLPGNPDIMSDITVLFSTNSTWGVQRTKISHLHIASGYKTNFPKEVFVSGKGRYAEDATITTINTVYENPSHIIESLARDEAEYATADIDTAALDTAATDLTGWVFAFQLLERRSIGDIYNELGQQCKSKIYYDDQDRLTMKVLDDSAGFAHSGDDFPAALDIVEESGSPTSGSMTRHSIKSPVDGFPEFTIGHVGIDTLKNDFVLRYRNNYASDGISEVLYMTNGLGTVGDVDTNIDSSLLDVTTITPSANAAGLTVLETLCADSYAETGTTNTWEFNAWAIRDKATATKLLQYYIERLSVLRATIQFPADENIMEHDVADVINVRHDRLLDRYGTGTMRGKKWEILRMSHDLDRHFVTVRCIELNYDD